MPHIALNSGEPGIRGLLVFRPETGRALSELAEVLLRGPGTLARGERELIAAYVSALNDCRYCASSHSACAAAQLPGGMEVVEQVRADAGSAPISAKLKALLVIASAVQQSGLQVLADEVAEARAAGATDLEIHDTVLIAAAFCMFNRYVRRAGHERPARSRALRSRSTAPDQGRIPAAGKPHLRKLTQPSSPQPSTPAILATPVHQARPAHGRQKPTYAGGTAASYPKAPASTQIRTQICTLGGM